MYVGFVDRVFQYAYVFVCLLGDDIFVYFPIYCHDEWDQLREVRKLTCRVGMEVLNCCCCNVW